MSTRPVRLVPLLAVLMAVPVRAGDPGPPAGYPGAPTPVPTPAGVPPSSDPGLQALVYTLELSADRFCPGGRTVADAGRDASSQVLGLTVKARSGVRWPVSVEAGGGALRMYDVSRPNLELGLVGFRFEGRFSSRRARVVARASLRPPNNPGRYRVELRTGNQLRAVAEFTVGWDPDSCPRPRRRRRGRGPRFVPSEAPPPGFPVDRDPSWEDLHGPAGSWPGSPGPDGDGLDEDERVPEIPQRIFQ